MFRGYRPTIMPDSILSNFQLNPVCINPQQFCQPRLIGQFFRIPFEQSLIYQVTAAQTVNRKTIPLLQRIQINLIFQQLDGNRRIRVRHKADLMESICLGRFSFLLHFCRRRRRVVRRLCSLLQTAIRCGRRSRIPGRAIIRCAGYNT